MKGKINMKQEMLIQTNVLNGGGGTLLVNNNVMFLVLIYFKTHIQSMCFLCGQKW